jgi:colanic acid biosynthesis glycosyl transferase WcaI
MHLVFINQYYPPDGAPTGIALAAVVEELAALDHEVTVICAEGGYAEMRHKTVRRQTQEKDGINVVRIRATKLGRESFIGKLVDYLSYYLGVAWHLAVMLPKPNRVVALTTPPYLSLLARVISKTRGADHAHWVMDLYPDVMVAHGILKQNSLAHRALTWLARWGMGGKRCAALLTLGPDMAERLANQCKEESSNSLHPVSWVPLWSTENENADDQEVIKRRHEMGWKDDELVVMYSGNMGLGHRFGEILEHISQQPEINTPNYRSVRFAFFGGGKRRREISEFIEKHPNAPIELHDYAPAEILTAHLRSADVHLVTLDAKWSGTMLPSKLQGIFTASRPVIFIGDTHSSIGKWVKESAGGWIVAPGNISELEHAILEARDPKMRESLGRAAKAFADANFDCQTNVQRVANILVY